LTNKHYLVVSPMNDNQNLEKAVKHLKSIGWNVTKIDAGYRVNRVGHKDYCPTNNPLYAEFEKRWCDSSKRPMTAREVIKFSNCFDSLNNQHTAIKKKLKKFSNGKDRTKVRNVLTKGDTDEIDHLPTKEPAKKENIWNLD
jgi:hypothetical protein